MIAVMKREIKNYLKRPLFWIGVMLVIAGVFLQVEPYLKIHYVSSQEEWDNLTDGYPETVHEADAADGYVPTDEGLRREYFEKIINESLIENFEMSSSEAETVIGTMKEMDIMEACEYLEQKSFSYYFSRKFADFAGLFTVMFATVMLAFLFLQDTRKNTYELLHTKPVGAAGYVIGKIAGGIVVCVIVLVLLCTVFWAFCLIYTKDSGFQVKAADFFAAACMYILPNIVMIVCVYGLISILFQNPLPAVPVLILYIVYSNMGGRNAEGIYGYYGRPLAIMVRFPGQFFDTAPPPMALLSAVFCADTYAQEIISNRTQVGRLYPMNNRIRSMVRRMTIQQTALFLFAVLGYLLFYVVQKPSVFYEGGSVFQTEFGRFFIFGAAIAVTLNFWGMLCHTLSVLFRNMWAGIGCCLLLWSVMFSRAAERILGNWGLFSYTFRNIQNDGAFGWIAGKIVCIVFIVVMWTLFPQIIRKRG